MVAWRFVLAEENRHDQPYSTLNEADRPDRMSHYVNWIEREFLFPRSMRTEATVVPVEEKVSITRWTSMSASEFSLFPSRSDSGADTFRTGSRAPGSLVSHESRRTI